MKFIDVIFFIAFFVVIGNIILPFTVTEVSNVTNAIGWGVATMWMIFVYWKYSNNYDKGVI